MPFCGKCGASVNEGAAFCGGCGAPVASAPGSAPAPVGTAMASNAAAALTYLLGFVTGVIFLVLEPYKNDRFVRFHAFQSIFFSVAFMVFWFVWHGLFWTLFIGLHFLWWILSMVGMLVSLGVLLLWLFLMYKAYNNERFMLPVIGEIAARQAG